MNNINNYCNTSLILDKVKLKQSSVLINKVLNNPAQYFKFSIDNICTTIPITINDINALKCLPDLFEAETDFTIHVNELVAEKAIAAQFIWHIQITNQEGYSFSIFHTSLTNRAKAKSNHDHENTHNEGKFDVNPNTFGLANMVIVLSILKKLWPSYDKQMAVSRLTAIDYTADIPDMFTPHVLTSYSYPSQYRGFVIDGIFTGFQYGAKKQCPIKVYDKALEQGGKYLGHVNYTRFEKTYRPRCRGNKFIPIAELDSLEFNFRGLHFYDPKLLIGMPDYVLCLLLEHGIDRGKAMLSTHNKKKLEKRIEKNEIKLRRVNKNEIMEGFKEALRKVKNILLLT